MEEAWTSLNEILYSRALMNRVKVFTGAILDSRRDGVQVHASHFSRPPSLTVAEGGLYSCLLLEDGHDEFSGGLRCGLVLLTHWSPAFPLCPLSRLARGTRPGRGLWTRRNFPDVWYKSKKKEIPLFHRACLDVFFLVLFTFDAFVESVFSLWWVGGIECAR